MLRNVGEPQLHLASYVVIRFCCRRESEGGEYDRGKADCSSEYGVEKDSLSSLADSRDLSPPG